MKIVDIETESPKEVYKGSVVNPYYAKQKKRNKAHIISFWFKYPGDKDFVDRIRNQIKAHGERLDMRYKRMIKIANSESEAKELVLALGKDKKESERKYRIWLRREARRKKEENDREFRETVKAFAGAIKRRKRIG